MRLYARVARGAEAGAVTAGAIEASFFVLDLVRLRPLATPATLSGAGVSPGNLSLDLTGASGAVDLAFAAYQIGMLTLAHLAAFALAGVVASLAFDWRRPGGLERFGVLAAICSVALLATVMVSSSLVALGAIGGWTILGMLLAAPMLMGSILRVLATPEGGARAAGSGS
jgi:hypothetical protein